MNVGTPSGVADCVRSHVAWMTACSTLAPHPGWDDGPLSWRWSADGRTLHAAFPHETPPALVQRAVEAAEGLGATEVAVWSAYDVARPELEALGFRVGWQPCWMVAPGAALDPGPALLARRAGLTVHAREHEAHLEPLLGRGDTWRAEARTGSAYAGRAWLHVTGEVAGLYDMAVWHRFRRRGHGSDLVHLLGATARDNGAERLTLNATPEGEPLYAACGFERVGRGRTWWRTLGGRAAEERG